MVFQNYNELINLDLQWLIVFILLLIIIFIKDFKPIQFVEPGDTITVGEKDSILDTTLWQKLEDGKTIKIREFSCSGIYTQKVSDYQILLRSAKKFDKGWLKLETSQGSIEIPIIYGLGSDYYYLVPHQTRYFQYERNQFALVSDVFLGFNSSNYQALYSQSEQIKFMPSLYEKLKHWEADVLNGKLIRPTARKYRIPIGLIKYLAKEGKKYRLSEAESSTIPTLPHSSLKPQQITVVSIQEVLQKLPSNHLT